VEVPLFNGILTFAVTEKVISTRKGVALYVMSVRHEP